jgi:hypothetical protein
VAVSPMAKLLIINCLAERQGHPAICSSQTA